MWHDVLLVLASFIGCILVIAIKIPIIGTIHIDTSDPKKDKIAIQLNTDDMKFIKKHKIIFLKVDGDAKLVSSDSQK